MNACKLCFGITFLLVRNPVSSSFQLVISAKGDENRPSLKKLFCYQKEKTSTGRLYLHVLLDVFLRSGSRFLVGPSSPRMGKRPAFFCARTLPRAHDRTPEAAQMISSACPDSHHLILLPDIYLTDGLSLSLFPAPKGKT